MGLFDFIKKQFVDVIQFTESEDGVLAYQYPFKDMEIQNGAELTVRESQMALFVDEGRVADLFGPGRYTLTTKNLPILTNLKHWDKAFKSPFKSDVYFFSTRLQTNQKWGTPTPITIRDKEFGPIRIRAFGSYGYRIADPVVFYRDVSGTRELYMVNDIEGQLRALVITTLSTLFGQGTVPFIDMAGNQTKFSQTIKESLAEAFTKYGLKLESFEVQSISLPDELQKVFDEKASMNMLGDLGRYAQFQTAKSIPTAAANPGGLAGVGASLGLGATMGQAMGQSFGNSGGKTEDVSETLNKLHELLKKGILTQAEFDAKKAELLKKL